MNDLLILITQNIQYYQYYTHFEIKRIVERIVQMCVIDSELEAKKTKFGLPQIIFALVMNPV